MSLRLAGRVLELTSIRDAVREGRSVVVRGRPGSGVSAVLAHTAQVARDAGRRTLIASCSDQPVSPVAVLEELLDGLPESRLDGPGATAGTGDGSVLDRFTAVLGRQDGRPLSLVVDDAHRAGPTILAVLAEAADLRHVSVVLGAHGATGDVAGQDATLVVDLPGLDRASVARLVSDHLGRELDPASPVAAGWSRASGGSPLMLQALLAEPAVVAQVEEAGRLPDPAEAAPRLTGLLPAVLRERLLELTEPVRGAVAAVACAGEHAPAELLLAVAAEDDLRSACASGLLVARDDGGFSFRHRAAQRLVVQETPRARRTQVHLELGRAARDLGLPVGTVAHHLLAAAPLDPLGAVQAAQRAAAQATAYGAQAEAAALLARAADAAHGEGPLPRFG